MCACNFSNNLYMNHTGEVLPHLMPCGMQTLANTIHRYSSTFPPRAFIKMNEHCRDLLSPRPQGFCLWNRNTTGLLQMGGSAITGEV